MGFADHVKARNLGRGSLCLSAVVAMGIAHAQSPAHGEGTDSRPPRLLGNVSNAIENCYRLHGRSGIVTGEIEVTVTVDAEGRVTSATSAPGTPLHLAAAAQCVAVTMRFEPATNDGAPVAGKLAVNIGFPTSPQLRLDLRRTIEYCQPAIDPFVTLNSAYEGQLDLLVKVGKDGHVIETVLPDGLLAWMEQAGRCVAERLEFFPARLHLIAVESWATVPVDFNLTRNPHERVRLDAPTVRSDESQILTAYRECYPPDRRDELLINYRITITEGGRVRKADVVRTSGDEVLDRAGVCILRKLTFFPARRNGRNVVSTVSWPILVWPPG